MNVKENEILNDTSFFLNMLYENMNFPVLLFVCANAQFRISKYTKINVILLFIDHAAVSRCYSSLEWQYSIKSAFQKQRHGYFLITDGTPYSIPPYDSQ